MRVFLAGTSFNLAYGGPAFSVGGLAKALSATGVEVGLWAPDGSALSNNPALSGVRGLAGTPAAALAAFGRPDVVHDNDLWRFHHHALAKLAATQGIPRVVSTRGMLEPWAIAHKRWKKRVAWTAYQRQDLRRAACLHTTSPEEACNVGRLGLGVKIACIPNAVDVPEAGVLAAARAGARRDKIALFLGRIYPVKGLPMLVEAWARVRPPGWRLHIAGPDEAGHLAEVKRAISNAGLADVVDFLGPVVPARRTQVYAGADLFVLPSYSESFGMSIAEALAHSLPVLTTTGAPWPMLAAKGCGWQVPPSAGAIASALAAAVSTDDHELKAMGERGRFFVAANFGWAAVAEAMIELYREAMAAGTRQNRV